VLESFINDKNSSTIHSKVPKKLTAICIEQAKRFEKLRAFA